MAKQVYYFTGKAEWLLTRPNKWGKYTLNFFPKDADDRRAIKATGIKNTPKVCETGEREGQMFYTLRSDEPFVVTMPNGEPVTVLVGNGSDVTVKLEVEQFTSPTHGETARSKVLGVVVNNLIEYKRPEPSGETKADLPA